MLPEEHHWQLPVASLRQEQPQQQMRLPEVEDHFVQALIHLAKVHCEEVQALQLKGASLSEHAAATGQATPVTHLDGLPQQPPPSSWCDTGMSSTRRQQMATSIAGGSAEEFLLSGREALPGAQRNCKVSEADEELADKFQAPQEVETVDSKMEAMLARVRPVLAFRGCREHTPDKQGSDRFQDLPDVQLCAKCTEAENVGNVEQMSEATNSVNDEGSKASIDAFVDQSEMQDLPEAADMNTPQERWAVMCFTFLYNGPKQTERALTNFDLLPYWVLTNERTQSGQRAKTTDFATSLIYEGTSGARVGDMRVNMQSRIQRLMMPPHARRRLAFVLAGIIFLAIDAATIPLWVFELGDLANILNTISKVIGLYWFIDLFFQAFVGYQTPDGTIEMRPARVQEQYLRGAFLSNFLIVLMDLSIMLWEMTDNSDGPEGVRAGGRSFRFLRLFRLVRLLRARRLAEMTNFILNRMKSEYMVLGMKLAKHVVLIFMASHYIACVWYYIATTLDEEVTWIQVYCEQDASMGAYYATAMHWALTQFSPSTQNIAPTNVRERVYASCVVLFALLAFSSIISGVTNAVNQLRTINMSRFLEEARIREFLQIRDVSTKLVGNVQQFFSQNYQAGKKRVHESDIRFFSELPESLMIQLHEELYQPVLLDHVLFRMIVVSDRSLVRKICHTALQEISFLPRQDVFIDGTEADGMYFVTRSILVYEIVLEADGTASLPASRPMSPSTNLDSHLERVQVPPKRWVSEMALWMRWMHRGHLIANDCSETVKVVSSEFGFVVSRYQGRMSDILRTFAILCVAFAEDVETNGTDHPVTDLPIDEDHVVKLIERALAFSRLQLAKSRSGEGNSLSDMFGKASLGVAQAIPNIARTSQAPESVRNVGNWRPFADFQTALWRHASRSSSRSNA